MKIKIISGGDPMFGTKIINAETGEAIEDVISIKWEIDAHNLAKATLEFLRTPVEIIGETEPEKKEKEL